jgi:hypothetical protein
MELRGLIWTPVYRWTRIHTAKIAGSNPASPTVELPANQRRAYLIYLSTENNVATSIQNVALPALLYLYQQVYLLSTGNVGNMVVFDAGELEAFLGKVFFSRGKPLKMFASLLRGR